MIGELKPNTWYYLYTDGENLFISDDPPVKESESSSAWFHFDKKNLFLSTRIPPFRFDVETRKMDGIKMSDVSVKEFLQG